MAEIPSIPGGAVPPKKETGKVQPKKETVRINLPPKPSAAPTIKLPTLPPGGPTGGSAPGAPTAAPPWLRPTRRRPSGWRCRSRRGLASGRCGATRGRRAMAAAPAVSTLDTISRRRGGRGFGGGLFHAEQHVPVDLVAAGALS